MSTPAANTVVIADGKSKLTAATKTKPKINAWLAALLWSVQDLSTNIYAVIQSRNWLASPPTGDLLTRMASLVGIQRNGQSDVVLWTLVLVQLRVLRSNGLAEDVLQVANLITPSTYTDGNKGKKFYIESYDITTVAFDPLQEAAAIGLAKDGGSRGVLKYSTWPVANNLVMGSRYGGVASPGLLGSRYGGVASPGLLVAATEIVGS